MIKIIGLSALALGFILHFVEWLYDFKLNGWSFATVLSVAVLFERIHHNRQMRIMLKQIGDKVGVKWNAESYNFNLSMARKVLRLGRTTLSPALFTMLFTRRKVIEKSILSKEKMKMTLLKNPWSKKLFAFLLLVAVNGLNDTLGLNLSHDTVSSITGVGQIYIISQAAVDMFKPLLVMFIGSLKKTGVVEVVDTKPTVELGANK